MLVLGRDGELRDVLDRLRERRLVTITGPGGIGKTALADVAATTLAPDYPLGMVRVDLTRVDHAEGVAEAIAAQLGYADYPSLINSPGDKPVLMLVDNCEHVLEAAATATADLLAACRMPTVLATSRSPLDLPDESIVALGPLPVPPAGVLDSDAPALRLLLARARDQGVSVRDADLPTLAEICRRLDGVPLALEIAAARLRAVGAADLLRDLDDGLHRLARRHFRGRTSHRSVGDLVAWSTELLSPAARTFFVRLGVFAGPFTAAMAVAVAGDGTDDRIGRELLEDLVTASLVAVDRNPDATWYRLLHPVRAVALDGLERGGELPATRSRFVDQVVAAALDVVTGATDSWGAETLHELLELYDNIAASLRWTVEHDDGPDRSLVLLAVLWGVVHQAHTTDVRALGERVLDRWDDPRLPWWPDAAATVATCRHLVGDVTEAIALATRALPDAGSSVFAPATLRRVLARAHKAIGDGPRSLDLFAEAAAAAEASGTRGLAMELRVDHGQVCAELGDVDGGLAQIEQVYADAVRDDAPINRAWAAAARGAVLARHDPAAALPLIEAALADASELGYPSGRTFCLRASAVARIGLGDLAGAAAAVRALVEELLQTGGLGDMRMSLDLATTILHRRGDPRWADLGATAAVLPVTSVAPPMGPELVEEARGIGAVLTLRDAYQTCREALLAVADDAAAPTPAALPALAPDVPDVPTVSAVPTSPTFDREGEVWCLGYAGRTVRLATSKGLADLATLVAAPGREVSCLELAGSGLVHRTEDELVDATARRRYEDRVRELQAEIEEAEAHHDIGRVERLHVELDALVDHLTAALGLGGRSRRTTGEAERARSAVTQRIRSAIRRIERHHPELGAHLRAAVSTGTFCRYRP